jgi:hypothetical protein
LADVERELDPDERELEARLLLADERLLLVDARLLLLDARLDPPDFFDLPPELPLLRRSAIPLPLVIPRLCLGLTPEPGTISPRSAR